MMPKKGNFCSVSTRFLWCKIKRGKNHAKQKWVSINSFSIMNIFSVNLYLRSIAQLIETVKISPACIHIHHAYTHQTKILNWNLHSKKHFLIQCNMHDMYDLNPKTYRAFKLMKKTQIFALRARWDWSNVYFIFFGSF